MRRDALTSLGRNSSVKYINKTFKEYSVVSRKTNLI